MPAEIRGGARPFNPDGRPGDYRVVGMVKPPLSMAQYGLSRPLDA